LGALLSVAVLSTGVFLTLAGFAQSHSVSTKAGSMSALSADNLNSRNPAGAPTPCAPPPAGMVAWYPGDGNANDIIGDNNGTLQGGVTFAPGEVAQAFNFNGIDSFVNVTDAVNLHLQSLTIDAWVNLTDSTQDRAIVIKSALALAGNDFAYGLRILAGGHAEGRITDAVGNFASVVSASVLTLNQFQHVALTYDGAALKLYLNGVLDGTTSTSLIPVVNTNPVSIGAWQSVSAGTIQYWLGLIDEVEIFNRALSQPEIQSIVNAGSSGKCKSRARPTPRPRPTPAPRPAS